MAVIESFETIKQNSEHMDIIKKSKFIGLCFYAETAEECKSTLEETRKKYSDATHHCYAYHLGVNNNIQKFSDDGEPSGTAGMPIFKVIQHKALKNILVIVVRYYGGIKLGAGGLARAYSGACSEALKLARTATKILSYTGTLTVDYQFSSPLEHYLRKQGYVIENIDYAEKVSIKVLSKLKWNEFSGIVTELCNGQIQISECETLYYYWD